MRLAVVAAWLTLSACGGGEQGDPVPGGAESALDQVTGVRVVSLSGWGSQERPVPDTVRLGPDDAVVFQVADFRVHTVAFLVEEMSPAQDRFIRDSVRVVGPPLTERGSRYVVRFRGAPPGRYPYLVEGLGEPARGAVVIEY